MNFIDFKTHFGIENVTISPLKASGASINRHFLVTCADKNYVLRNIRTSTALYRLDEIHEIISNWNNAGIPLTLPILTLDGKHTIHSEKEEWQLTVYLSGSSYSFIVNEMEEAAKLLRTLHAASPVNITNNDWFSNELKRLENELPELKKWSPNLALLLKQQMPWLHQFKNISLPPLIATHGDFHGLNLLFKNNKVTALLDFDDVNFRPRLYDIAHAILMLCRLERGSYQLRPLWSQKFLEAYGDCLTKEELKVLPAMMFLSKIPSKKLFEELTLSGINGFERAEYYHRMLKAISEQVDAIL